MFELDPSHNTENTREVLTRRVARMISKYSYGDAALSPEDVLLMPQEYKKREVERILRTIGNALAHDSLITIPVDKKLGIDADRKTLAAEAMEAGILTPREAAELIR